MCLKLSLKLGSYTNLILKTVKIEVLLKVKLRNFTTLKHDLKHKDYLYEKISGDQKFLQAPEFLISAVRTEEKNQTRRLKF